MFDKTYSGWKNYETWVVTLYMENEEPNYLYWRDVVEEIWDDAEADDTFTRSETARRKLAARLKEDHEEEKPALTGVWCDLLDAALSEVDWLEIAESLLEDCEGY